MVATDSYRLSVKETSLEAPLQGSLEANVPARALQELARIAQQAPSEALAVSVGQNQVVFELGEIVLSSRLIDGQFPNYQQVLPKGHTTRTVVDRDELFKAVRLAALIANAAANIVKLQVGADGGGVVVTAAAEVGDNEGLVEATVEGDGTTIAFNSRYLSDVLQNVTAEQFAIELNGPLSPGVFRPIGDDTYTHVVMPVRTTS